jgi:NAD(P)-dependent dehydrogenase (short-subunit alcohol dehydrogenase family)
MSEQRLQGKRVLLTQADDYMGPATIEVFEEHGAEVIADRSDPSEPGAMEAAVASAGHVDILVVNLAAPAEQGVLAVEMDDNRWQRMFDVMVHPLHRLCRATLPQMYGRRSGKVVVYGSATGLKPKSKVSAYSTARSAQVGYVKAVGQEAARHNVQVNLIAQNFVENPVYYPPELVGTPAFDRMLKQVPLGRLATGREDALLALFLASGESDFFVGQAIPFAGGWVQ